MGYDFETKKEYDTWLLWSLSKRCNLNCEYCPEPQGRKNAPLSQIEVEKLLHTLVETGRTFNLYFTGGGEPFLVPGLIDACREITKKHFISFDTNLTGSKIEDFSDRISPDRVVSLIASTHIKELERLNLLDRFVRNFLLLQEKGFPVGAREVAYPPLLEEAKQYKMFFKKKGIDLSFRPFAGIYRGKRYPESYTMKELETFEMEVSQVEKFKSVRMCNAGYNAVVGNEKGDVYLCTSLQIKVGNLYEKVSFRHTMVKCPLKDCECSFPFFDSVLYQKAISETDSRSEKLCAGTLLGIALRAKVDKGAGQIGNMIKTCSPALHSWLRNTIKIL